MPRAFAASRRFLCGVAMLVAIAPDATAQRRRPAAPAYERFRVDTSSERVPRSLGEGDPSSLLRHFAVKEREDRAFYALAGERKGTCAPSVTHDADRNELTVVVASTIATPESSNAHIRLFPVSCTRGITGTEVGAPVSSNRGIVTKVRGTALSVGSDSLEDFSPSDAGTIAIAMPAKEAETIKARLKLLLVFNVARASRSAGVLNASGVIPVLDARFQHSIDHVVLWSDAISAWIVDGATGRVIAKRELTHPLMPRDGSRAEGDRTYFEFQVEKSVSAAPGSPQPAYPVTLKLANVEGAVLAQFVVDTMGRADMSTFKVLRSSHDDFTQAVRAALPSMRFQPAEIGGRKVRQVVQQPFLFEPTK